jgi:ligand-binding sensor domain-containing protein
MKRLISVAIVVIIGVYCGISVNAQYKIVNYTDMNQINSLTEDGDYIWVSTSGGAFKRKKSDGSLVKVVNTDNSGITRNAVNTMFIDFFGNYWFGTYNGGICKFDGNTWTSYNYVANKYVYSCNAITSDLNGDLWFGVSGGVLKYSNDNWTFFDFNSGNNVRSILADDLGNVWASISGLYGGLWKISPEGAIENIPGPGDYFQTISAPYDLHKDNNNNIWAGTWGGLFAFSNTTGLWTDYRSVMPTTVHSMTQDNLGNIWFGTEIGAVKYNGTTFAAAINSGRTGTNVNLVMDILSDSQGKVWIGSYNGLAQVNQSTNSWTPPILLNCLPTNWTETIAFDSNNKAWVCGQFNNTLSFDGAYWNSVSNNSGTNFGWIKDIVIDNLNNKYLAVPGSSDKKLRILRTDVNNNTTAFIISGALTFTYVDEVVKDVQYDALNGKIWVATNQGLFWFKISTGGYGQFNQAVGALKSNSLNNIAINGTKVWYSTSDAGIGYYDQSDLSWKGYSKSDGLQINNVGEMVFDRSNNLWFLTNSLGRFDGATFQTWSPSGLSLSQIACDTSGNIWVGGWGGVAKFRGGNFKYYTTNDGLIENRAGDIVVDALNNVWITTSQFGLSKMIPQAPVAEFTSNIVCLPGLTYFTNTSTKMDTLSTYEWDINNDGSIESTSRDFEIEFDSKAMFPVKLKVSNDGLSSEVVHQAQVLESPDLSLNAEGDRSICFGESQNITVNINNQDPMLTYQVSWNNGTDGTQQIWASEPGEYYATVNNGQCERTSPILNLSVNHPFTEEKICMVTVDVESGKNLIIWERTSDAGISSYNVYKLFGNTYVPIGNVSALDISEYIDYTSTPDAMAARYAISSIDTCGNESEKSAYHQTIQLGASEGITPNTVVLDWTNYIDESKIWQPAWYYIYRGNDPANLILLDSISSAFTEWNDLNPSGSRYYQVLVKKSNPCDPADLLGKKTSSGPFVHSLSNLEDNRLQSTGINGLNAGSSVSVFPNPFSVETTIRWRNTGNSLWNLNLYDIRGSLIRQVKDISGGEYHLTKENLKQGIYLLEISGDEIFKTKIFVK